MCRLMGPRCDDHPARKLEKNEHWIVRTKNELVAIAEELRTDITNKRRKALLSRQEFLGDKFVDLSEKKELLQLEYAATTRGRRELAERIAAEKDEEEKALLEAELAVAKQRRKWQRTKGKELDIIEKSDEEHGTEKAIAQAAKEAAAADKKIVELKRREVHAQNQMKKFKELSASEDNKRKIKNIRMALKMMRLALSFYALTSTDLKTFMQRRQVMLLRKVVLKPIVNASIATFGR